MKSKFFRFRSRRRGCDVLRTRIRRVFVCVGSGIRAARGFAGFFPRETNGTAPKPWLEFRMGYENPRLLTAMHREPCRLGRCENGAILSATSAFAMLSILSGDANDIACET